MSDRNAIAALQAAILKDSDVQLEQGMRVLDVGCGNGTNVQSWIDMGFDAYGCDFVFKEGPLLEPLKADGRIAAISTSPYRMPYPDDHFDVIVTNQVMEHVLDYPTTLADMRRVLKPGGHCLHMFPSRGFPMEPHVHVPLASFIKSRPWLSIWARLGLRKPGQEDMTWREVVDDNHQYLTTSTNFLTGGELKRHFRKHFEGFRYVDYAFLKNSPNQRGRKLFRAAKYLPIVYPLYRAFWARIILVNA